MSFATAGSVPTEKYTSTVTQEFPTINRSYKLESSIKSRYKRDHLPISGATLGNGQVKESYLEFLVQTSQHELLDLQDFSLELKIKFSKNGQALQATDNVTVIDGLGERILSMMSLFCNSTQIESHAYFNVWRAIDTYTSLHKNSVDSIGRNMYYHDLNSPIHDKIEAQCFEDRHMTSTGKKIKRECTGTIHMMIPVKFNISSSDFYLLSGCNLRVRFDLASPKVLINTPDTTDTFSYSIEMAKLWAQKVVPEPAALISLNRSLLNGKSVSYIHERPVLKNFVFPSGHSSLQLDDIFSGFVPNMVYLVMLKQNAVNGEYNLNAAYFQNAGMNRIRMELDGNVLSSMNVEFPDSVANIFHHTLTNLKNDDNMLNYHSFKNGRTILAWDLRSSDCSDVLNIERAGSLRLQINTAAPLDSNLFVFVFGITSGLVEIFGNRVVKTSYVM